MSSSRIESNKPTTPTANHLRRRCRSIASSRFCSSSSSAPLGATPSSAAASRRDCTNLDHTPPRASATDSAPAALGAAGNGASIEALIFGEPAGAETFDLILASLLRGSVVAT
jgi:hypothetical protein